MSLYVTLKIPSVFIGSHCYQLQFTTLYRNTFSLLSVQVLLDKYVGSINSFLKLSCFHSAAWYLLIKSFSCAVNQVDMQLPVLFIWVVFAPCYSASVYELTISACSESQVWQWLQWRIVYEGQMQDNTLYTV